MEDIKILNSKAVEIPSKIPKIGIWGEVDDLVTTFDQFWNTNNSQKMLKLFWL